MPNQELNPKALEPLYEALKLAREYVQWRAREQVLFSYEVQDAPEHLKVVNSAIALAESAPVEQPPRSVEYRLLWTEYLWGEDRPVPFSGKVYRNGIDGVLAELAMRSESGSYHGLLIEARPSSESAWPHPCPGWSPAKSPAEQPSSGAMTLEKAREIGRELYEDSATAEYRIRPALGAGFILYQWRESELRPGEYGWFTECWRLTIQEVIALLPEEHR